MLRQLVIHKVCEQRQTRVESVFCSVCFAAFSQKLYFLSSNVEYLKDAFLKGKDTELDEFSSEGSDVSGVVPLCHCRNITKWSFQLAALLHHHQVTKNHFSSRLWRNICGSKTGSDLVACEFYLCTQMRLHFGARLNWCTYAPWLVSDSHYVTGDKQAPPPLRNLFLLSQLASCWNVSDPLRFHLAFITWGLISSDVFIQSEQQKLPGVKVFKRVSFYTFVVDSYCWGTKLFSTAVGVRTVTGSTASI